MKLRCMPSVFIALVLCSGCQDSTESASGDELHAPDPQDSLLIVPDNGSNRVKLVTPHSHRILNEVDLAGLAPDLCNDLNGCMIFSAGHTLIDGHDRLELAYGLADTSISVGFQGHIDRIQLTTPPTVEWRLHALDFSMMPGNAGAYCPADPADPCQARTDVPLDQQDLCYVGDAHDFEVLSDDTLAQRVELLIADTDNYRLLKVTLDYANDNTCGRVDSVLDATRSGDWAALSQPNNLVRVMRDGRELFLVTLRSTTLTNAWLDGNGQIQLWELESNAHWRLHWTFPEPSSDGTLRVLHFPHGGELFPNAHPEGDLFRFADSASLSADETQNVYSSPGGSVGVLLLRDMLEPPDYLYDQSVLSDTLRWRFPRAVTREHDGTLLLTDSGCISPNGCPYPGRLMWVQDEEEMDSRRLGYWTPDHSQLELLEQGMGVKQVFECGLVSPFMSLSVPLEERGEELNALMDDGGWQCP